MYTHTIYMYTHTLYIYIYTHIYAYISNHGACGLNKFTICKLTQEEMIKQNAEKWIL